MVATKWSKKDAVGNVVRRAATFGDFSGLRSLLLSYAFLSRRLAEFGSAALIEDFKVVENCKEKLQKSEFYTDEGFEAFSSVSQVIYQVEDLITEEPTQLPSQLLIRLSDHRSPTIEKFCERLKRQSSHTWLRPLLAEQPDSRQPLERIINTGHNQDISLAAISGDGRWAITSTGGAYFKVWDLEVFRESATCHLAYGEETFKSDFGPRLSALGITYDGRFAVVSITKHREKTILQVWDLSACEAIDSYMLSESGDWPSSISISQDSNVVIVGRSYSTENYIWVRDARSDKNLPYSPPLGYGFTHSVITYQGESLSIVAVSPDASWAAVHHSGLLQIVNLSNGRIVQFFPASDVKRLQINGQNLTALLGDFSIQTWSIDASLTKQSSSVNFLKIYQKPEHPYVSTSASLVIMARIAVSSLFSPSIKRFILNRRWTKRYLSILLLLIQKGISKIRKRESRTSVKPIDFVYLWKILKKSLPPTNTVKKTAQLYRAEPLIDISPEANKGVTTLKDKLQVMNLSGSFIVTTKEKKIRKKTVDELQDLNTLQTDWLQKNTTICLGTDGRSIVTQPKARRKYGKPPAVLKVRDLFSRDSAAPESIPLKATMFSSRTMAAQYISSPFYSRNIGQRTGELYLRAVEFLRGNMLFGNIIFPRPWWQTKSISACGRYALLQSPTCTLKITDQKTGKSLGVLHDLSCFLDNSYFFINVSDEKGSSACISSEGKYVLIYGTYCFPKYIDSSTSRYIGNRYLHDTRGKLLHDFGGIYSIAGVDQKDRTGVYVWNVSERCISSINISERVRFAFPSQNKALFLVGSTNKLFILDPSNLSIVSSYSSKADITSAAISEDGSLVAYADSRQVVKVFDTKNGKVIGAISLSYIAIDLKIFSSDGELVYVSALDTEGKPYLFYLQILAADKSNIKQSEFSYELNSELVVKPATVNWEQISEPVPQRGVDFQLLSSYLAKEEWKRADEITSAIICKFFDDSDRKQFDFSLVPHSVLTSLDEIWLKHSRGRYGFSVQLFIALMLRRVEPYMSERSCPEDNTALLEFDTSKFRSITGHARFNKAFKGEKFSQLRGHYPTILLRGKFSWLIRKSLSQFQDCYYRPAQNEELRKRITSSPAQWLLFDDSYLVNNLRNSNWIRANHCTFYLFNGFYSEGCLWNFLNIEEEIYNMPFSFLELIDRRWLFWSKGRFGITTQIQIFYSAASIDDFLALVGWGVAEENTKAEKIGHFPVPLIYEGEGLNNSSGSIKSHSNQDPKRMTNRVFHALVDKFEKNGFHPPHGTIDIRERAAQSIRIDLAITGCGFLTVDLLSTKNQAIFNQEFLIKYSDHAVSLELPSPTENNGYPMIYLFRLYGGRCNETNKAYAAYPSIYFSIRVLRMNDAGNLGLQEKREYESLHLSTPEIELHASISD